MKKSNVLILILALYVIFMVLFGFLGLPAKHVVGFIAGLLLTDFYAVAAWFVLVKILGRKISFTIEKTE